MGPGLTSENRVSGQARLRRVGGATAASAVLARQLFKLGDAHFPVLEHRPDLKPATYGFHIAGERTDADVGAVLNLRDLALIDAEDFCELLMLHFLCFSQLVEGHGRETVLESLLAERRGSNA